MANPALSKEFGELPAVTDATLNQPPPSPITVDGERMSVGGTAAKTGFLLLLVLGAGSWGWNLVDPASGDTAIPGWWFFIAIGVFILAIVTAFRPQIAVITGPLYSLTMGVALGVISHIYDDKMDELLDQTRLATDAESRQEAIVEVSTLITEQAYMVPLYAPKLFYVLSNRVKDAVWSPYTALFLNDAYIED